MPYKSKAANINNSNREALNTSIDQANNRKNNTKNSSKNKNILYQKQKNQKLKYLKKVNIKILGFKKWNNLMKNVDILEYIYYINIDHIINNQIPKEYLNNIYIGKGLPWDLLHMNDQIEINEKMRSILIDWIIDIHYNFGRWNFIYGCFNNR